MVVPKSPDSIINELIYEGKILGTMTTIGKNGARFVAVHNIADRFHTGYGDHPDEAKANADELVLKHLIAQNSLSHQLADRLVVKGIISWSLLIKRDLRWCGSMTKKPITMEGRCKIVKRSHR